MSNDECNTEHLKDCIFNEMKTYEQKENKTW